MAEVKWGEWGSGRPCLPPGQFHSWRLENPGEPPPRTLVCDNCGKHVPPLPSDSDYEHAAGATTP